MSDPIVARSGSARTSASALLSAADIWSTDSRASTPAKIPETEKAEITASAEIPETKRLEASSLAAQTTALAEIREPERAETPAPAEIPEPKTAETIAPARTLRPSELLAEARFFSMIAKRVLDLTPARSKSAETKPAETKPAETKPAETKPAEIKPVEIEAAIEVAEIKAAIKAKLVQPQSWPPRKLSLALQGGGSFGAFTWGVLERLLEQPDCEFDAISGASVGAVNAVLLACGLVEGGREGARKLLARFWNRVTTESSFRSLMLIGGFSPAGSSVAFGPTLRSAHFDPFDLDPLRQALTKDIRFSALSAPACPKLLIAATRIRDGKQQIFRNAEITADVLLASTCPPLVHCAVEIEGEAYWDGGYSANPPLVRLVQESETSDVLVVQVTPARDGYVPITMAAIDRRLDQITANSALNAEIAAIEWLRDRAATSLPLRLSRIAAEDEIEGLSQRSSADLGHGFIRLLHRSGRDAADRWLRGSTERAAPAIAQEREEPGSEMQSIGAEVETV
jgi:NTE family protein